MVLFKIMVVLKNFLFKSHIMILAKQKVMSNHYTQQEALLWSVVWLL